MDNPDLHIIDDRTLDTVVACAVCDWEGRYSPFAHDEDERIESALTLAAVDHDCGPSIGPLN